MKFLRNLIGSLFLLFQISASGAVVRDTVHINRGSMTIIDTSYVPALSFNEQQIFSQFNFSLEVNAGDSLYLVVHNNDSLSHQIDLKPALASSVVLAPGAYSTFALHLTSLGIVRFYSDGDDSFMGLGSFISVGPSNLTRFHWNIQEQDISFMNAIQSGSNVNPVNFKPGYFTINGLSNPLINTDPKARVTGSTGDTLLIYAVASGNFDHSLHFHGYHLTVLYSTDQPEKINWSKDTYPLKKGEGVVFRLVPDKPGEYPIHDHNLSAIVGGNYYPNGMLMTMLIN